MARLPGHEDCTTCPICGLTDCPDCDSEGQACPIIHKKDQGSSATEYALMIAMLAAVLLLIAGVGLGVSDTFAVVLPPTSVGVP